MHFVQAKSILSPQNGMNVYRGCVHGCTYCDIRTYGEAYELPSPREKELQALPEDTCRKTGTLFRPEEAFSWISSMEEKSLRLF